MPENLEVNSESLSELVVDLRALETSDEVFAFIKKRVLNYLALEDTLLILLQDGPISSLKVSDEGICILMDRTNFNTPAVTEKTHFKQLKTIIKDPIFIKNKPSPNWIAAPLFCFGKFAGYYLVMPGNQFNERASEAFLIVQFVAEKLQFIAQDTDHREKILEVEACHDRIESIIKDLNNLEQIKSDFISVASHELRTPLTVTRGYVEFLMEDGEFSSSQRKLIDGVYKGVLKQEEILDSLFELARFDTISPVLNQESVSLGKLTKEIVKKLSKPIQERNIRLIIEVLTEQRITVDAQSIWKMLLNLIQNAIKFTPDHGEVTIEIRESEMTVKDGSFEPGILITIKDSGVGIDQDQLEAIFTRFYYQKDRINTHSSGKTKFKGAGLGLGLALSRAIAQAHNGWVWAESSGYDENIMPGSQFKVFLPNRK